MINRIEFLKSITDSMIGVDWKEDHAEGTNVVSISGCLAYSYNKKWCTRIKIGQLKKSELSFAVDAAILFRILDKIKTEEIDIDSDGKKLIIKAKRNNIVIPVFPHSIQAQVEKIISNSPNSWNNLPLDFIDGIKSCCLDNSSSILLMCGNKIMSTDNRRMCYYKLSTGIIPDKRVILLSMESARKIIALKDIAEYCVGKEWIYFKSEGNIFANLLVGDSNKFPFEAASKLLEYCENNKEIGEIPKNLKEYIIRASLFFVNRSNSKSVDIESKKGTIIVSSSNESGSYKATTKAEWLKEDFCIGIDVDFVLKAIGNRENLLMFIIQNKNNNGKIIGFTDRKYMQIINTFTVENKDERK